ncbi:GPW/gp25 family protein [Burkholderia cenocepacia]|uniref:GPW/gp25 family protein n=1 Tax=Burkholderia cenocepacia TaxID=95486 RepID=UPI001B9E1F71|nr:GPW/gp25 family protein [Burkholderia cenocepacia]MBR8114436.1 GPW/gp25 family protein [Burkholderia cenocepacia]
MIGMNATTGRATAGLSHLYQSIAKILTTPIGTRIARRDFGSELPDLIDAPNNGATRVRLYAAIATALMQWEPRLRLTRVQLSTEQSDAGAGVQVVEIEGTTTETGEPVSTRVPLTNGGAA